ncbi:organic cation transporter protein-like [Mercenaria mercenaria]|uniref:organic cation transporter protein-like n=1 Tax=Mercenaria mercenaria TaxID=6596 RepID=UPI00234F9E75|nr:organic cation transporter protein-like [Mercenaria mercenaria]
MQFDLIYKEIGDYGCYQRWIVWAASSTAFYAGLLILTSFFVLAIPEHRCAIPGLENDTYEIQNEYHRELVNRTIPLAPSGEDYYYDQCHYMFVNNDGEETLEKCGRWVYDKTIFKSSLAADLNMVCDDAILKSNAQMVNFAGIFAGSLLTGIFSDKFGRKTTMCTSLTLIFACSLGMAWSPNYTVFIILTFFVGFFNVGQWMPAFVIRMEFVGPSERKFAGYLDSFIGAVGKMALAGMAYFIRDWSTLLIAASLPGVLYLPFWFKQIFPESARWLFSRGKTEEGKAVINRWAKWNKIALPQKFFDKVLTDKDEQKPVQGNLWNLFSSRVLAIRTILIFIIWLTVCLSYYGLTFNVSDFGSDLYLNFMLQALVEIPAIALCLLILDRVGRKPVMVGSMFIGGAGCLATIFTLIYLPDKPVATTILALIGKMGLSAGFTTAYIYSSELFPTVVRNSGLGASSCMARVGGMVAPYIAELDRFVGGRFGSALPQVVFGVLSIVGGIAAIFLPETLNRFLPETIEQGQQFGKVKTDERAIDKTVHINAISKTSDTSHL